jgi:hypothetical protein
MHYDIAKLPLNMLLRLLSDAAGALARLCDVWKRDHFAWEYWRRKGNLDAALLQLMRYVPALESPPLPIVYDIDRLRSVGLLAQGLSRPADCHRHRPGVTRQSIERWSAPAVALTAA